jgi:hypothetical protein
VNLILHYGFKAYEKEFPIQKGTFRNKVSEMLKNKKIQLVYYSPQAFYTIRDKESSDVMTTNRAGVMSTGHDNAYAYS